MKRDLKSHNRMNVQSSGRYFLKESGRWTEKSYSSYRKKDCLQMANRPHLRGKFATFLSGARFGEGHQSVCFAKSACIISVIIS